MRSNRTAIAMRVAMAIVCAAGGFVTLRLWGQLPVGQVAVIHRFTGGADSANPATGLIQLPDGNFAGMTKGLRTRSHSAAPATIYTMTPDGTVTTLYTFARDGSQGGMPLGFMQASDGNFYGTAIMDRAGRPSTAFRLTPAGQFTLLYTFPAGDQIDTPASGFVEAPDGNLYAIGLGVNSAGCIFRVNLRSQMTSLFYSFASLSNVWQPSGMLTLGPDGRLYGVTYPNASYAGGNVYAIDTSGNLSVLAVNTDPLIGGASDRPAVGSDGYLYFASGFGGSSACPQGCGTIYRVLMSGGNPELLYSFSGGSDRSNPGSILLGSDGMFYGRAGGAITSPSVYQFDPVSKTVAAFDYPAGGNGLQSYYPLMQAASGVLRGTTQTGGSGNSWLGASFALNLALPAPKPMITGFAPVSGPPGTVVTIWGANFVGLQDVRLNGVSARGQAKAAGFIRFAVPSVATTGPITVTTAAGGSVASSVNFIVR